MNLGSATPSSWEGIPLFLESSLEFLPNLLGEPLNHVGRILGCATHMGSEGRVVDDLDSAWARKATGTGPSLKGAYDTDEADRDPEPEGQPDDPTLERLRVSVERAASFGEDQHGFPGLEQADDLTHCPRVWLVNVHGKGSKPADQRTE